MADFPTFDLNAQTGNPISVGDVNSGSSRELSMLSGAADVFGQRMRGMANAAAGREGAAQADQDAKTGTVSQHNPDTAYGVGYNDAAKLAKGADYKAALLTGLNQAALDNPADPVAYGKAATAVRAGLGSTGFPDLDRDLNAFTTLQVASGAARVQAGQNQAALAQAHQGFMTSLDTEEQAIGHVVTTASYDLTGSGLVAAQLGHSFDALAKYGPRTAFDAGGRHYEADPSRAGILGADDLQKTWQDMSAQARSEWTTSAAMALPDAAAKQAFATDAQKRYVANDPLFAGMDREQFDHLGLQLDSIANRAATQEDGARRQASEDATNMIEAIANGASVDTATLMNRAVASGDAGLLQKAKIYSSIGPQVPDVLRQVEARTAAGASPDAAWAQPLPTGPVYDQVRLQALNSGVDATGQDALIRIARIESGGNPSAVAPGGSPHAASGIFQFQQGAGSKWEAMGGGDPMDAQLNISRGVQSITADRAALSKKIGRQATWGEAYVAHQQGLGGALAFLHEPGQTAIQALIDAGVSPDKAKASILGNGGTPTMTAVQFAGKWISKVDGGADPTDPNFVAWANTSSGFRSDPLSYARGDKIRAGLADVVPLNPDGFGQPDSAATWTQALRDRYATGQSLASRYAVPPRMLTDGEKAYYAQRMEQDPAYGVALAGHALTALGPQGAQALIREIGSSGNAPVALHMADLRAHGATRIVDAALDGLRLQAQGAKLPDVTQDNGTGKKTDPLDDLQVQWAPAFTNAPQALVAARAVADAARLSDRTRGIVRNDDYYLNGALGATNTQGQTHGGVGYVNGRVTALPAWLGHDQGEDALKALGRQWQAGTQGPAFSDGSPMAAKDIGKLQMVMLPTGQYGLVNPKTNAVVRDRQGALFSFDLDSARTLMGGQ